MIKEIFINNKRNYKEYVIFIKNGNFYLCLGDDAKIINSIFNYKLKEFSGTLRVGFPIISLNKVIDKMDYLKINYIVFEKEITLKRKFNSNRYNEFLINNLSISDRINNINIKLNDLKTTNDIFDILEIMEKAL